MNTMPGNQDYNAAIRILEYHDPKALPDVASHMADLQNANTLAVLALAYEQRTANVIAHAQMFFSDPVSGSEAGITLDAFLAAQHDAATRLGFGKREDRGRPADERPRRSAQSCGSRRNQGDDRAWPRWSGHLFDGESLNTREEIRYELITQGRAAAAALETVRQLHKPMTKWEPYEGAGYSFATREEALREAGEVDLNSVAMEAGPVPYEVCTECGGIESDQLVEMGEDWGYRESLWPCPTAKATAEALGESRP